MSTAILSGPPSTEEIPLLKAELFEVIDGERVVLPSMATLSTWFASILHLQLTAFDQTKKLGRALSQGLFRLPAPVNRDRRTDIAFVSYQRWAKERKVPRDGHAWDVVPNLCIEVVSPTDGAEELETKVIEYFRVGVEMVWVVYPLAGRFYVYESSTQVRRLTANDELDGGAVLPGFRLALAELFAEASEEFEEEIGPKSK